MDFLKTVFIAVLITCSVTALSQDHAKTEAAFSSSYSNEASGEYRNAISNIKGVYQDDSYAINLRLAWLNYLAGYYTESISYYNKSIKLNPLSVEARFGLTYPAAAISNWDMVISQYKDVIKTDVKNYTANLKLGQIYLNRKEYKKAEKHLDLLLNMYPFNYDVVINSAWNYYYLGKLREAKVLFNQALLLNPGDESAKKGVQSIK